MRHELTDRYLRSLSPPDEGRIEVSDTKRKGLRFRLYAPVSAKSDPRAVWMYEKRVKGGVKRKHTLGIWPAVGLREAREIALEIEAEAAKGIDRVEIAQDEKLNEEAAKASMSTVQDVLEVYGDLHLSQIRTGEERKRQLLTALAPFLSTPINALSKKDLQAAIDEKMQAGRIIYSNRIRAALKHFTNWAFQRSYLETDIGASLPKRTKERARERVLSISEVQTIWRASFEMKGVWGSILRLLLLTGQRRGEILNLRWDEVDFAKRQIVKSGEVTKNGKPHITHLSEPALNELAGLNDKQSGLVFTTTGHSPISGISRMKKRLDNHLGNAVDPWRLHDIRTALATALAEAGEPENVVDRILNHSASGSAPSAVARVYNKAEQLPQRAKALDKWAEIVTSEQAKVVRING